MGEFERKVVEETLPKSASMPSIAFTDIVAISAKLHIKPIISQSTKRDKAAEEHGDLERVHLEAAEAAVQQDEELASSKHILADLRANRKLHCRSFPSSLSPSEKECKAFIY